MEFAEGGGMFDLLSKQLFLDKLNKFHFWCLWITYVLFFVGLSDEIA